jgi:hypothetical protein
MPQRVRQVYYIRKKRYIDIDRTKGLLFFTGKKPTNTMKIAFDTDREDFLNMLLMVCSTADSNALEKRYPTKEHWYKLCETIHRHIDHPETYDRGKAEDKWASKIVKTVLGMKEDEASGSGIVPEELSEKEWDQEIERN